MTKINKKDWLAGLILGAINSTLVIKDDEEKRRKHTLEISEQFAEIILQQFNDSNWE